MAEVADKKSLVTHQTVLSRRFNAPPPDVYEAFTRANLLSRWFGPLGYHVPASTVDLDMRAGGHFRLVMVNDDDPDDRSPVDARVDVVSPENLLVAHEYVKGFPGLEDGTKITLTVTFEADEDGTRVDIRQGPFTEQVSDMGVVGWNQSFFKLDALLDTPAGVPLG